MRRLEWFNLLRRVFLAEVLAVLPEPEPESFTATQ